MSLLLSVGIKLLRVKKLRYISRVVLEVMKRAEVIEVLEVLPRLRPGKLTNQIARIRR